MPVMTRMYIGVRNFSPICNKSSTRKRKSAHTTAFSTFRKSVAFFNIIHCMLKNPIRLSVFYVNKFQSKFCESVFPFLIIFIGVWMSEKFQIKQAIEKISYIFMQPGRIDILNKDHSFCNTLCFLQYFFRLWSMMQDRQDQSRVKLIINKGHRSPIINHR